MLVLFSEYPCCVGWFVQRMFWVVYYIQHPDGRDNNPNYIFRRFCHTAYELKREVAFLNGNQHRIYDIVQHEDIHP